MIKVLSGEQMKKVDKQAIEELHIPGILLMENAGRAVCDEILELIGEEEASVLVICGKGNNGGDGFVAARHLIENGVQTTVVSLFRPDNLSGSALTNHDILLNFTEIAYFEDIGIGSLSELISCSDIVVDSIFGTGLSKEVTGFFAEIVNTINEYAEGEVIAVDIPSGVNADTGEVLGCAVIADYTVTMHTPKTGLLLYPGADHCGEVVTVSIGIPDELDEDENHNAYLITKHYANITMPFRPDNSNKGTFGKVFNIAGSYAMPGAAYMCSMSSLIVGCGYSFLATPKSAVSSVAAKASEVVFVPLKETEKGAVSNEALSEALDESTQSEVVLIGPGLGTDESTVKFVVDFIQQVTSRGDVVLIDGDGLNAISMQKDKVLPVNSVITPHPKELARLMGVEVDEILKDKLGWARKSAKELNTVVVLKGANTIIAEPNGNAYLNTTGNSGLAKAGSGDVLSGMIAGFIAQDLEPKDAAILGVYLHGLAADLAVVDLNEYSLTATWVIEYIPHAINKVLNFE